jgi:hypothetical protein
VIVGYVKPESPAWMRSVSGPSALLDRTRVGHDLHQAGRRELFVNPLKKDRLKNAS